MIVDAPAHLASTNHVRPVATNRITVVGLGGTISMQRDADSGLLPAVAVGDLARALENVEPIDFLRVPSCELTFADLRSLAVLLEELFHGGCPGVVVTTGTDALEEVAFGLDLLLDRRNVVVTGAMRGADAPGADGPANLAHALVVARSGRLADCGVTVCIDEQVHAARYVRKVSAHGPGFASPTAGPIGRVVEGRLLVLGRVPALLALPIHPERALARVTLVAAQFDDDGLLFEAAVDRKPQGIVVEALGGGHVSSRLAAQIERAAQNMPVVFASRTEAGPALRASYGYAGGDADLVRRGAISARLFDARKARVALTLMVTAGYSRPEIADFFDPDSGDRSDQE